MQTITEHYIDGAFVESHGREGMDIIKPTNGKGIARATLGDEEDTRRAIAAAKRAFVTFGRTTKEERASYLRRLHEAVLARIDDLTAAMVEEYGGVVQFARPIVQSGANAFLAAERGLQELPWTRSWGKTTVTLEPVGVAGLITAWNANALFICLKLASAVGAGCTVVIKPSELSSLQTQADFDKAVPTALGIAFLNSGQACAAGTRLLVPKSRLDAVKRIIREAASAFPVGDPADPKTAVGPMVSQKQYERVQSYIHKGIEEGAEVLVGGEGHPSGFDAGYFVKPTVFVNVRNDMTIAQEEIFGPVLCVIAYDTEEDAIRIANDTKYGLHAFVSGTDIQRARRVASRMLAGRVAINGMLDDPDAPWGGFKYSGIGREFGRYGIEAFLETRAILE
jgi:acyl-CoA reductase-like NAD-dependent aldehyde dehydrogenase